jgi:hypothetical protein
LQTYNYFFNLQTFFKKNFKKKSLTFVRPLPFLLFINILDNIRLAKRIILLGSKKVKIEYYIFFHVFIFYYKYAKFLKSTFFFIYFLRNPNNFVFLLHHCYQILLILQCF